MREVMNAIFYVLLCAAWRHSMAHAAETTYRWFMCFRDDGIWESLNPQVMLDR